ncbi:MAG: outer membrane protein assembly factor BamA [candidate division Zixibacteria bacterium]|nr:outer membrane protein assembly factor BamA [candidate division Zixibacteria bacterium]
MRFPKGTLAGLILLSAPFFALTEPARGATIGSISVVGAQSTDPNLIISVSGLQNGNPLSYEEIQQAIHTIYGLRLFSDVKIAGDEQGEIINLTIVVKEFPKIRQVLFDGNKKIKNDRLTEKISLQEGDKASPNQVQNALTAILDLYREKGYVLAEVETNPIPHESGDIIIEFKITEGPKVKLKDVYFAGNRIFSKGKLKGKMSLKIDNFQEKLSEGKDNLTAFYRDNGYLDFSILQDSVWYSPDKKYMYVWVRLEEGKQYRFGQVTVEGEKLFSSEAILHQMKFKPGEIFSQKKLEESLSRAAEMYFDQGHLYVQIKDNLKTEGDVVDISLNITEGIQAHVNLIHIEGNTKTKEKVIRRELYLKPGDLFRRSLLVRSIRNVMILNYFANVTPDYQVLENGDVDLVLKIEEKPTGQISFGAGYSERDKLVGTISLGIPNLFGNGQSASLSWDFGKRRNSIQVSFTEPWFRDTPTTVGFDLYSLDQRWYSDFTEKRDGVGLRLGKRLTWPDNYFRVYWRYRIERVKYDEYSDTYLAENVNNPISLEKLDWPKITSSMDVTLLRDSRDLSQFATKGSVLSANTEFSGGVLQGDWNYIKEVVDLRRYTRLLGKLVLFSGAKFGVIDSWKTDVDAEVPYSERFSPGGTDPDGTIRGYPDSWVGPKTDLGGLLRGRSLVVYNMELQLPIVEQQIYLLAFGDAGNAWLSGKEMQPLNFSDGLFKSLGLGVRIVVPSLGMIGFDYGYGFDYTGKDKGRIHFQFGQQF